MRSESSGTAPLRKAMLVNLAPRQCLQQRHAVLVEATRHSLWVRLHPPSQPGSFAFGQLKAMPAVALVPLTRAKLRMTVSLARFSSAWTSEKACVCMCVRVCACACVCCVVVFMEGRWLNCMFREEDGCFCLFFCVAHVRLTHRDTTRYGNGSAEIAVNVATQVQDGL